MWTMLVQHVPENQTNFSHAYFRPFGRATRGGVMNGAAWRSYIYEVQVCMCATFYFRCE